MGIRVLLLWVCVGLASAPLQAAAIVDFEGITDGTLISTEYPGLSFSNALLLTAGISLNEQEFPPRSGVNVVSDYLGPVAISFISPAFSVGGYFTYAVRVTINAYDASSNLIGSMSSAFSNNEEISGEPGSSPNEFLQLTSATGISRLSIAGDMFGGSFALDDLTYASDVPEPGALALAAVGLVSLLVLAGFRRNAL